MRRSAMKIRTHAFLKFGSAIVLLASAGSWVWAAVIDAPKPSDLPAAGSQIIGEPYKVLLHRSIFSRDGLAAPLPTQRRPWSTRAVDTQPSTTMPSAPDPEADFVLRGVGMQDG